MASAKATIDHDEIRRWVEARGGHPAHVKRSGDDSDPGILRIDYPGFSGQDTLERIPWDEFFDAFDSNDLAFLYQDKANSRFSKLVDRSTVDVSARTRPAARKTSSRKRSATASRKRTPAKRSSASTKRSASASRKRSTASRKRTASAKRAAPASSKPSSRRSAAAKRPARARTVRAASTGRTSRSAVTTTDHNEIKRWVEKRGGFPAHVKRTGSRKDPGVLRIDYPGYSGRQSLERISWNDWFNWFDRDKLAFLYQKTASSRFSKLVRR